MFESPCLVNVTVITVRSHPHKVDDCLRDHTGLLGSVDSPRYEAFPIACTFNTIFNRLLWITGADEAAVERVGDVVARYSLLSGHKTLSNS
jgi:hypothetical protein